MLRFRKFTVKVKGRVVLLILVLLVSGLIVAYYNVCYRMRDFFAEVRKPGIVNSGLTTKTEGGKENAAFVVLARNSELYFLLQSIREVEDRFNRNYHYPWIFLNEEEFTEDFKSNITKYGKINASFGKIDRPQWSYPDWIDQERASKVRKKMKAENIIYGDSVSYRFMCRYESGLFFWHPLLLPFDYYWRVEPGVKFFCDINYDVFQFMREKGKKYGFAITVKETKETVDYQKSSLWDSTKTFIKKNPHYVSHNNLISFVCDDQGLSYNLCHFWSNFEIGSLNWFRSEPYTSYFEQLDKDGGFFYSRWGDAPVHSVAVSLLMDKDDIHFFDDVGYYHPPFLQCPRTQELRGRCHCNPSDSFDWKGHVCLDKYLNGKNQTRLDR